MEQFQHTATLILASFFALSFSSCGEQDEVMNHTENDEKGIAIESITATLQGMQSEAQGATTRETKAGFSVNTMNDPTYKSIEKRGEAGWKMDFTLYNDGETYEPGSFTAATYDVSGSKWTWGEQKYFPHYTKPDAEAVLYPENWTSKTEIATDQNIADVLLAQDILVKAKGVIDVAHEITITLNHKHSMLDFVIKNVNRDDIENVTVSMDGGSSFDYTPYKVATTEATGIGDIEYMLIVPEGSTTNPIVRIVTKEKTNNAQKITYKQTIDILKIEKDKKLVANSCYCFTLQGADLKISPITILNWVTGESLPGEYIAVTAYPTFKAKGYEKQTFYFYYDSKLKENGMSKLQAITFNENAECTIKPDGRILTHIYKPDQVDEITKGGNKTPKAGEEANGKLSSDVVLGKMVVDVKVAIESIVNK